MDHDHEMCATKPALHGQLYGGERGGGLTHFQKKAKTPAVLNSAGRSRESQVNVYTTILMRVSWD